MTFWFGEPWPSRDRRAPICEDDESSIAAPAGEVCTHCAQVLTGADRGVAVPYLERDDLAPATHGYWHLRCFLAEVCGEKLADELTKGLAE